MILGMVALLVGPAQIVALAEQLQFSPAEALAGTGVIAFRSALGQRVVRILELITEEELKQMLPAPGKS